MFLYPEDIFVKTEFDKVLERLSSLCSSDKASELALKMRLFDNPKKIERSLHEVSEYKKALEQGDFFTVNNYESIDKDIFMLRKEGYTLSEEEHLRIFVIIKMIGSLFSFFEREEIIDSFPYLYEITTQIMIDQSLVKAYNQVFNDEGEIKENATPALASICRSIRGKEIEIDKNFSKEVKRYKDSNLLSDTVESFKNGRRVLSVTAENKRKIRGVIRDESSTGKTVFIEPEIIVELNNDLFELRNERRQEIFRILRQLSDDVRPYVDDLDLWQKIIVRFDLIYAKARMAKQYDGNKVEILPKPGLDLKEAYHPLLVLINKELGKETVGFNMRLDNTSRMLVISGPNAGGKSVTMKAVGLMQMMFQAGMLVPAAPDSKMGVFSTIMTDIGDQQSLEEDLSTYSSRLLNMKAFISKASQKSLILIDEFGSGTDPKAGGAIAEAILKQLEQKKAFGVITTHYSNIKMYAFNSDQILNGAMVFDKENLTPRYELEVGRPGSSYAFEIASKTGLPHDVINYAKKKAGKHDQAIEELLLELQNEKKEFESKLAKAEREKQNLSRLIKSYEEMSSDLEVKRKRFKLKEKEAELSLVMDSDKAIQKLIREIKESNDVEKAKDLSNELRAKKNVLKGEMRALNKEAYKVEEISSRDLVVGDFVKLSNGDQSGEIISIKKGKALVQMGIMSMEVELKKLISAKEPIQINSKRSISSDVRVQNNEIETKIDLRGYTKSDAEHFFQEFVDKAMLSNHTYFEVLHGKGTGVLRRMVLEKLKEYRGVRKVSHPSAEFGGDGITKFEL